MRAEIVVEALKKAKEGGVGGAAAASGGGSVTRTTSSTGKPESWRSGGVTSKK